MDLKQNLSCIALGRGWWLGKARKWVIVTVDSYSKLQAVTELRKFRNKTLDYKRERILTLC
jgi:hypothetical protein